MNLERLNSWHADWSKTKVLVFGLGVSGFAATDTLVELGSEVIVLADKADAEHLDILNVFGVKYSIGKTIEENLEEFRDFAPELFIVSPGIRPDNPLVSAAVESGIPVWTEVDLAWRLKDKWASSSKWICITGTNGKTTVTQMVEKMLQTAGIRALACGNIGVPVLDAIRDPAQYEALVVELSSFQLHYLNEISPLVSAVLNVADDHLDWHGSLEAYAAAKGKIYHNTQIACIYNATDSVTHRLMQQSKNTDSAQAVGFTLFTPAPNEVGWVEDILIDRAYVDTRDEATELATMEDLKQIPVISPHLLENTAAAAAIARGAGVQPDEIKQALNDFALDAHRIQLVLEKDGVRWIDDSKATNPHAASAALASFDSVIWIAGGLLKGVDISALVEKHSSSLKAVIVIGLDRAEVLAALANHAPDTKVFEITEQSNIMQQVVTIAKEVAEPGDVVLLAPAAASMDQFVDYADRGNSFVTAVKKEVG